MMSDDSHIIFPLSSHDADVLNLKQAFVPIHNDFEMVSELATVIICQKVGVPAICLLSARSMYHLCNALVQNGN